MPSNNALACNNASKPSVAFFNARVNREELLEALNLARKAVGKQTWSKALKYVKISAVDGALVMQATDGDHTVTINVGGSAEGSPATALLEPFYRQVVALSKGFVTLNADERGDRFVIEQGRTKTYVPCIELSELPVWEASHVHCELTVDATELFKALTFTSPAQSTKDDGRYYLQGTLFELVGRSVLKLVATDGHRLHLHAIPVVLEHGLLDENRSYIVPKEALKLIVPLLSKATGPVKINFSGRTSFVIDGITVETKMIDGTFPDYNRVLPKENDRALLLSRKELPAAIKRVTAVKGSTDAPVEFELEKNKLTLKCVDIDYGVSTEAVDVNWGSGDLRIGFKKHLLLDTLDAFDADILQVDLLDAGAPALVRDPRNLTRLIVLMPVRV